MGYCSHCFDSLVFLENEFLKVTGQQQNAKCQRPVEIQAGFCMVVLIML
jgi:hypothetical protein